MKVSRELLASLSPRQRQALSLIARGLPNKCVADEMRISKKTVDKHRQVINCKLNIHDPVTMTHLALALGVVENLFEIS